MHVMMLFFFIILNSSASKLWVTLWLRWIEVFVWHFILDRHFSENFQGWKLPVTPCSHLQSWIKQSKIWNSFDSQYPYLLPINLFISCRYGIHLWDIGHTSMWEGRSTWSYNTDMMMELALYIVDFAHHLHMLVRMN